MRSAGTAVLAALAVLATASSALAADPRLSWSVVDTPHFQVHYPDGLGELAQRSARALEAAHSLLAPALGHVPRRRVVVLLADDTDSANGSATAFLRPEMNLLAVAPDSRSELNDYEDFLWNLVVHEYTHVLHLDEASGIPEAVNRILGKVWIPNGIQPRWLIEGLAVLEESRLSGSGRERSSIYDMYLRAEVVDGHFFSLSEATGAPSRWPRGVVPYLHGSRFMEFVGERYGADAFRDLSRSYGAQPVPFAINLTARKVLGKSWVELYQEWTGELFREVHERLAAVGPESPRRALTRLGANTGEPAFHPDGRLFFVEDSGDRRALLQALDLGTGTRTPVSELHGGGSLALSPDGRTAFVSQTTTWQRFYFYEDLFRVDLQGGALERVTFGERVTEPAVSPDGRTLAVARRLPGSRMALCTLPSPGGPLTTVYEAPVSGAVFTPAFSPDGRALAFSEQRPAGRDIRLLDLESGLVTDVTRDRALDLDPAFDPSGRWLLFASDRTGIYDLYARDLSSGRTLRVTRSHTGAFRPAVSPDGKSLAFVTYSSKGYDLASAAFDPSSWAVADEGVLRRPEAPSWEGREIYPVSPYSPLPTLLPQYWLPVAGNDVDGMALGLTTGGSDLVGKHSWSLEATFGAVSLQPAAGVSWATQALWPDLGASASTTFGQVPGGPSGMRERDWALSAGAGFPLSGVDRSFSVSVNHELRWFFPFDFKQAAPEPTGAPPFTPQRGMASTLSLSASYSDSQRFAESISAERGQSVSVSLRAARPELGSVYRSASVDAAVTRYLALPWALHHVLAMRLAGGMADGDPGHRRAFSLGGIGQHDPILDAVNLRGSYGASLRGFRPGAFSGDRYLLANAEYRFPLAAADAGAWTLPVFLRRIHAAVTFDLGYASDDLALRQLRPSVGVEARTELFLAWALSTELRVGYARGIAPEGIHDFFLGLGGSY